jgi:hypothetical protein
MLHVLKKWAISRSPSSSLRDVALALWSALFTRLGLSWACLEVLLN